MRWSSVPKHLTLAGLLAICFGLAVPFFELYFLGDEFLWLIGVGIVLASVGVVSWSPRFPKAQRAILSAFAFVIGASLSWVAARNVHGAGLLFFLAAPALALALILLAITLFVPSPR